MTLAHVVGESKEPAGDFLARVSQLAYDAACLVEVGTRLPNF